MKKNCYFIFAALMLLTAACAQEELPVSGEESNTETSTENSGFVYIEAVSELTEETKAAVSGNGYFKWHSGDRVAVYAADGYHISEGLDASNNEVATCKFAFAGDFGQADRANFAVFPASLVCDEYGDLLETDQVTAEGLLVNLPATYNLSDVKDDMVPVPMIAKNTSGQNLHFKSICALVKFTLHSIPKQTQYITFDFNGKKVRGEFVIENVVPGDDATKAVATDTEDYDDVITVYNDEVFTEFQSTLVVNIPIPAGEYSKVTITTWDGDPWDGGHKINGITSSIRTTVADDGISYLSWNAGRLSSGKREIYMPVFTVAMITSTQVGQAGVKVVFAPGNLTATIVTPPTKETMVGTATDWRFAENQYDALIDGGGNALKNAKEGDDIDLFGWIGSKAKYPYQPNEKYGILWPKATYATYEAAEKQYTYWTGNEADTIMASWGNLEINGGYDLLGGPADPYPSGTWRLLKNKDTNYDKHSTEWARLLTARKDYDYCATKATIKNGETVVAYGLIIFPDHYSLPSVPAGMPQFKNCSYTNNIGSLFSDNVITIEQWKDLESVGCVFLPRTAQRKGATDSPGLQNYADGAYWTEYASAGTNAIAMIFSDPTTTGEKSYLGKVDINGGKSLPRVGGAAVRLVRQIN